MPSKRLERGRAHPSPYPVAGACRCAEPFVHRSSIRGDRLRGQCQGHQPEDQAVRDHVLWHCEHRWLRPRYLDNQPTPPGTTPASGPCPYGPPALASAFTYQATTTFELSDGSTLVLNESGLVCAPGNSASAPPQSFGFPEYANSSWTVESATGQFSELTGGGTDTLHAAGAHISGTYGGT